MRAEPQMFVLCFYFFSFDDHGLSTSLNHGWNLLSSLHHSNDDDLKGVFRYTHTCVMCVTCVQHVNVKPILRIIVPLDQRRLR